VHGGRRRGQRRAHPDAAGRGKFLDTGMRHFRFGAVLRLTVGMVTTPCVALLVAALRFAPPCASPSQATRVAAVDLASITATADIEELKAQIAPSFPKAVLRLARMHHARRFLTADPGVSLHAQAQRSHPMSRKKPRSKTAKPFQRKTSIKTETEEFDEITQDAARVFTCAFETAEDCAAECERRWMDLDADLNYRRVAHDLWSESRGQDHQLVVAMAALITENERHHQALKELEQRFEIMTRQEGIHDHIGEPKQYFDLIRKRLFETPPTP
jgi:hypothetical protein